jgi:cbb3-type cytochrome oxidase subunit 1
MNSDYLPINIRYAKSYHFLFVKKVISTRILQGLNPPLALILYPAASLSSISKLPLGINGKVPSRSKLILENSIAINILISLNYVNLIVPPVIIRQKTTIHKNRDIFIRNTQYISLLVETIDNFLNLLYYLCIF